MRRRTVVSERPGGCIGFAAFVRAAIGVLVVAVCACASLQPTSAVEASAASSPTRTAAEPSVDDDEPSDVPRPSPIDPLHAAREAFEAGDLVRAADLADERLAEAPEDVAARVLHARASYRLGRFALAAAEYRHVVERVPEHGDAWTGLGYALLQVGSAGDAEAAFRRALDIQPTDGDAERGLRIAIVRAAEREGDRRLRSPVAADVPLSVRARSGADRLELRDGDRFVPMFVKGFNLGMARPGHFPSEFPEDEATYRAWLSIASDLGANAIRLYTLPAPAFYRALAAHNQEASEAGGAGGARGSQDVLWLIQGVWAELPEDHDFGRDAYIENFEREIARVVDAVHGNLVAVPRPGHASGLYDTDVSEWTLAWLVGREWEPFAVADFDAAHPGLADYEGAWIEARDATAMEHWIARTCDYAAGYEIERYRATRPVSFANWPTLDPLDHPTEANRAEEDRWRDHYGIARPDRLAGDVWEDDRVTVDATRMAGTAANPAGLFASYHIYPNYPDFMNLDPAYVPDPAIAGDTRYAAYLRALKAHHGEQPVLVAEFGMSTSRGIAHVQPQGRHHGGQAERDQGVEVGRMLHAIRDADYAGGVVFSLIDEWFKGTWSVAPLEVPAERRRLWFNAESPEQSYGFVAYRPARSGVVVDGDVSDWNRVTAIAESSVGSTPRRGADAWLGLRSVRAMADEGWLYLLLETAATAADGAPPWDAVRYRVAIDTYDREAGERRTPAPAGEALPSGAEFLVEIAGPDASHVTVTSSYEPYAYVGTGKGPASIAGGTGRFVRLGFEANRERFARDGRRFPAERLDRGVLRFAGDMHAPGIPTGTPDGARRVSAADPGASGSTSARGEAGGVVADLRTDVAAGHGVVELRLPWSILNVADPTRHRVLHGSDPASGGFATRATDGFRIYVHAIDARDEDATVASRLPRGDAPAEPYLWDAWDEPTARMDVKRGGEALRTAMDAIPTFVTPAVARAEDSSDDR